MNQVFSLQQVFMGRMFNVPDYQRGYAWERRNWNDLIQDLELLLPGRHHFSGTLVLRPNGTGPGKFRDKEGQVYDRFDVIDGQQRLTTCILLLDAIHDELQDQGITNLAAGLKKNYLAVNDLNGQPHTRLTLNRDSQRFFYNNVLGFNQDITGPEIRSHQLLLDAHQFFADYLRTQRSKREAGYANYLTDLYFKVTQHLNVLLYEVQDELDAGVIFETMNDRGKSLTELEKVKNYLLYLASKLELPEPHQLREKINTTWSHIFEELMSADLSSVDDEDQLLRVHWLMAYDYNPRKWAQSRSIKERFNLWNYVGAHPRLLSELIQYLDSLRDTATAYCDIHSPGRQGAFNDVPNPKQRVLIVESSEKLVRLGDRSRVKATFLPILVAVRLKAQDAGQTYLQVVNLCEKFDFRVYSWMKSPSFTGRTVLFRLGAEYFHNPDARRIQSDLQSAIWNYCTNAQFDERFTRETEDWYRWSGLKYFLYEYELNLAAEAREKVHMKWADLWDIKRDTIEHVLPQTPTSDWLAAFPGKARRKRWTNDIGNLTLTYDNSSLKNKSFSKKKGQPTQPNCYASSSFFVERQLMAYTNWTEVEVNDRREKLRQWANIRWHIVEPEEFGSKDLDLLEPGERLDWLAEKHGVSQEFQAIIEAAEQYGVHLRPHKRSMVFAPAHQKNVALFTIWIKHGHLDIGIWFSNFESFLNLPEGLVRDSLGPEKRHQINALNLDDFLQRLEFVFTELLSATMEKKSHD